MLEVGSDPKSRLLAISARRNDRRLGREATWRDFDAWFA
jgi:hypothetical protein